MRFRKRPIKEPQNVGVRHPRLDEVAAVEVLLAALSEPSQQLGERRVVLHGDESETVGEPSLFAAVAIDQPWTVEKRVPGSMLDSVVVTPVRRVPQNYPYQ